MFIPSFMSRNGMLFEVLSSTVSEVAHAFESDDENENKNKKYYYKYGLYMPDFAHYLTSTRNQIRAGLAQLVRASVS
jgi:hypothetical protein